MDATAAMSRATDPVLHLVISYAAEEPTTSEMRLADLGRVLATHGLQNNLYYAVTHGDTDNMHVHIVVNRVGQNGTAAKMSFYKQRNIEINAIMSIERDWDIVKLDKGGEQGCQVISKKYSAQQSKIRGISNEGFEQYWLSDTSTLSEWQNLKGSSGPVLPSGRASQQLDDGREPFATRNGETVRNIVEIATSWTDLADRMSASGLDFAVTAKASASGEIYPGVAFRHLDGGQGASGTSLEVPYKRLKERFGEHPTVKQARGEPVSRSEMEPEESFRQANAGPRPASEAMEDRPSAAFFKEILGSVLQTIIANAAVLVRRKRRARAEKS